MDEKRVDTRVAKLDYYSVDEMAAMKDEMMAAMMDEATVEWMAEWRDVKSVDLTVGKLVEMKVA